MFYDACKRVSSATTPVMVSDNELKPHYTTTSRSSNIQHDLDRLTRLSSPAENHSSPEIIEISSDSEDNVKFSQSYPSKFESRQKERKHHESRPIWKNDVIELTDSDSSKSLNFPDILSPLVKGSQKMFAGPRGQQLPSGKFIPLYADTSDDGASDGDCVLVLNDTPGSRRPVLNTSRAKDKDVAKSNPLLDSPKKNHVSEFPRATQKAPSTRVEGSTRNAKEQAQRQKYATDLFATLNKNVFGDRLPENTTLEWSKRLLTTAGRARWHRSRDGVDTTKIELASKILDCEERIRNTLSHEMCHLACWVINNHPREGHGQLFKSWANKVMHKYPDIHISTRHNYEISYPYQWKCEACSKIYGRYSKSIRPDECMCRACKVGKLAPLFNETKRMTLKGSHMVAKPRDPPFLRIGTEVVPVVERTSFSTNPTDNDIPCLADALGSVSINDERDR